MIVKPDGPIAPALPYTWPWSDSDAAQRAQAREAYKQARRVAERQQRPSKKEVFDAARRLKAAGNSPLPIFTDGKKRPVVAWAEFQQGAASDSLLELWFLTKGYWLGCLSGQVSGHRELIDVDDPAIWAAFWNDVQQYPDLAAKLCVIHTQGGGAHIVYRCPELTIPGSLKLAMDAAYVDAQGEIKQETLIETRGEGAQALVPPTPGYRLIQGDLYQPGVITPGERSMLHLLAASYTTLDVDMPDRPTEDVPEPLPDRRNGTRSGPWRITPIDDYNDRGDVRRVLLDHGWTLQMRGGQPYINPKGNEQWIRPGKDADHGATYHPEKKLLKIWTTSVGQLEGGHTYNHAGVFARLECGAGWTWTDVYHRLADYGYGEREPGASATPRNGNGQNQASESCDTPETCSWADIERMLGPIVWEWPGWIARGFLHEMVAGQGHGKSMVSLRIAACYLLGWSWPDNTAFEGDTGAVLWCETEAAHALNIERAKTWGLPLDKILSPLPGLFDSIDLTKDEHRAAVLARAQLPEVKFVIVDSLRGAFSGSEDKSELAFVIAKWLADLAQTIKKPVLADHHLRKKSLLDIQDRVTLDQARGSGGLTQPARLVWAVDKPDQTDQATHRLSVIKSNLAKFPGPIGFTIDENGITFGEAPEPPRVETVMDKAIDLLTALLTTGPKSVATLEQEFDGAGLSWRSAQRAREKMHLTAQKKAEGWWWSLPLRMAK
jgi:hypothetical protein